MRIEERQIKKYLRSVKELKEGYTFYDMHVHPFELIISQFEYQANSDIPGLYSVKGAKYTPPELHTLLWKQAVNDKSSSDPWRKKIFSIMIRKLYGHTGPKVFDEHMKLSGTDKVLLLPVAPPSGKMEPQMDALTSDMDSDLVFLIIPENRNGTSQEMQNSSAVFLPLCRDLSLTCFDSTDVLLQSDIALENLYYAKDNHWTAEAHELAGESLADFLMKQDLPDCGN